MRKTTVAPTESMAEKGAQIAQRVGLVLLGLAAGLGVASYRRPVVSASRLATRNVEQPANVSDSHANGPRADSAQRVLMAAIEQQLRTPERLSAGFDSPPADEAPSDRAGEPTRDQLFLAAAQNEAIDAAWAREVSPIFAADLALFSTDLHARVGRVDCRTTRCLIELEWGSRDEAKAHVKAIVGHDYSLDCTRELIITEDASAGPVRTMLVFDCGQLVQKRRAPVPT